MKIAFIPARGGSKRIPGKNIRFFAGKPIIAYSIQAAKDSGLFDRIIVSTDSEEIAQVARAWGAEVPFRRPAAIADDFTPIAEVLLHAVQWAKAHGGCHYFCCIYPTAPFLRGEHLQKGFQQMRESDTKAAIAVTRFTYPIQRALKLNPDNTVEMVWPDHRLSRSQDLAERYHDAAQFFIAEADYFLERKTLLLAKPTAVIIPPELVHDIDTLEDWRLAELKYRVMRRSTFASATLGADLPSNASRIALGTAQLGFTYGISNRAGKPGAQEANNILCTAWAGNIRVFDTAQAYGDSEYILGDFFAGSFGFSDLRVISKLHPFVDLSDAQAIEQHVEESLRRIKATRLWCLLLHREQHLDKWDGPLGWALQSLREAGVLSHLGVSVYSPEYARRALQNPFFSVVEAPANVFDRRIARAGICELARDQGKMIVVRSVFLQGLALMEPNQVPNDIPRGHEAVAAFRKFCSEHGLEPREFAYDYVRSLYPDSLLVIGAETSEQVDLNCHLAERPPVARELIEAWDRTWPEDLAGLCDPSQWRASAEPKTSSSSAPS